MFNRLARSWAAAFTNMTLSVSVSSSIGSSEESISRFPLIPLFELLKESISHRKISVMTVKFGRKNVDKFSCPGYPSDLIVSVKFRTSE